MMVEWEDCEPTIENFWRNVRTVDPLNNLKFVGMILNGYYEFPENKNKSAKDLELDLRAHDINFGLIASSYEDDEILKNDFNNKKITFIKKQYQYLYNDNNIDVKPDHIAKYYIKYSCRPRKYVIEETLTHSKSMEENLEKLEESGDIINIINKLNNTEAELSKGDKDLSLLIREGKKLMKVIKVELSEIFKKTYEENKDAAMTMHAMGNDGSPIFALVKSNQIICPVGVKISIDTDGNKVQSYVALMR